MIGWELVGGLLVYGLFIGGLCLVSGVYCVLMVSDCLMNLCDLLMSVR